jgi:hypothetical protein
MFSANAMKGLADDVQSAVIPGAGHWFAGLPRRRPRRPWRR